MTTRRRPRQDRRRRDKYNVPMVKITGGQRIDLLGHQEGAPARSVEGPRHAVGPRLHEGVPHLQDVRRQRVLPLRRRRLHRPRHRHREALPGPRVPRQDEAGDGRLPAQLLRSDGQGRRRRRHRGRRAGRSTSAAPPARTSARATSWPRRQPGGGHHADRPLHAVLPRKRQVPRAHLRLRAADRPRPACAP